MPSAGKYLENLGASELQQHVEQTHALWGKGDTISSRLTALARRLTALGPGGFELSGIVADSGVLLASLKRYYFELSVHGVVHRCVGFGAVFCNEAHRNQGLTSSLLRTVLDDSRARRGCAYALLFSDISPKYYQRLGFVGESAMVSSVRVDSIPEAAPLTTRLATAAELPRLLDWHRRRAARHAVFCPRSETSWVFFHELNRVGRELIVTAGSTDLGLLSVTVKRDPGHLWVDEWLVEDGHEAAAWATVRQLALEAGVSEVRGWQLPGAPRQPRPQQLPMLAALDPSLTLSPADLENAYFASPDHF